MTSERSCGACTACCFALGVKPLKKPPFQRCEHQCAAGCGIYAERPGPCRAYRCAWIEDLGERRDRPDRLGVIFDRMAPGAETLQLADAGDAAAQTRVLQATKTVRARELRPGALGAKHARAVVERLHREGLLVVLVPFMGRRLPVGEPLSEARP